MTPLIFVLASVAGGVGAAARYAADVGIARLTGTRYPWGVFAINIVGSFLLGLVTAALPGAAFVVGVGLLGGFTTFSTAMLDTVALWREGARRASIFNAAGMLVLGILAAAAGLTLGALI
jgi:CrcB protein